jgi:transcriptional regulator with XRE-family HTH domain
MCAMIATRGVGVYHHHEREVRADLLLRRNIEALLTARRLDAKALARWCGHKGPWISKILAGERGVQLDDLGKIADFFGLSVSQLFQHGISALFERRRRSRRSGADRRMSPDRRKV